MAGFIKGKAKVMKKIFILVLLLPFLFGFVQNTEMIAYSLTTADLLDVKSVAECKHRFLDVLYEEEKVDSADAAVRYKVPLKVVDEIGRRLFAILFEYDQNVADCVTVVQSYLDAGTEIIADDWTYHLLDINSERRCYVACVYLTDEQYVKISDWNAYRKIIDYAKFSEQDYFKKNGLVASALWNHDDFVHFDTVLIDGSGGVRMYKNNMWYDIRAISKYKESTSKLNK